MVNNELLLGQFFPEFKGAGEQLFDEMCSIIDNNTTALDVLNTGNSVFVPTHQVEEFCVYAVEHGVNCSATLITKDGCVLIRKTN